MKRLVLLACLLASTSAGAQSPLSANSLGQVQMPPQTVLGNSQPVTAGLNAIPFAAILANIVSGITCPVGLTNFQPFANTAAAPAATTLNIWDGAQCVQWATLNQATHFISGAFGGTLSSGTNGTIGGQLTLNGSTNGTAVIAPQAAAGTPTITLPNASGTLADSAVAPLSLNATSGQLSITGAAGQVLAGSAPAFTATPTLGVNGGTGGLLTLAGSTSGAVVISAGSTGNAFLNTTSSGGNLNFQAGGTTLAFGNSSGFNLSGIPLILFGATSGNATLTPSATGGHLAYKSSSTPVANVCTGFALATGSSDTSGLITYTSAASCSITFGTAFTNTPFCLVTPGTTVSTVAAVPTTSGLTVTFGTNQAAFQYVCYGT